MSFPNMLMLSFLLWMYGTYFLMSLSNSITCIISGSDSILFFFPPLPAKSSCSVNTWLDVEHVTLISFKSPKVLGFYSGMPIDLLREKFDLF